MVNLRGIANRATSSINPNIAASIKTSVGYETRQNGQRVPRYDKIAAVVQVQALTYRDLTQLEGLNVAGQARAVYMDGALRSVLRIDAAGGDLISFPDDADKLPGSWLCAHVLEQWPDWVKVAIVQQNGPGS